MATNFVILTLFSAVISIFALLIVLFIFSKVYQEEYKKPWLFIGIATLFLAGSRLLLFSNAFYGVNIINSPITEGIVYMLEFISISTLTYGLLLELLIMKYYKGKFVKMKLIPVQEGTLGGELDINIDQGNSYISVGKERKFILDQFSQAVKKGFEGFLVTQDSPSETRPRYNIQKSPILWVAQLGNTPKDSPHIKEYLDNNSEVMDPLQLNNAITYIDQFIEQSSSPVVFMEVDLIAQTNNYPIFVEFIRYVKSRIEKQNGIFLCYVNNSQIFTDSQLSEVKTYLKPLD